MATRNTQPAPARTDLFETLRRPSKNGQPKYARLSDALLEAITSGHWKPGDKLPSEEELAEMTPFSLGTVQRALRQLSEQGIVVRQHGLGSFVAETDLKMEDPWHCRFLDDAGERPLPIYSKAVKREAVTAPGAWCRYFPEAGEHAIRIDRVISVNNEFNILSRFFTDRRQLPALWEKPLPTLHGVNFKRLIMRESNMLITRIEHLVRAMQFDEEVSATLQLDAPATGMFLQAGAYMGRDACVYYQEFFIPPTQRTLVIPDGVLGNRR
ncbi:MAG TPA: GntR family transcriptional regulator [Burkholderiaceae bacterium]|nr:GntR family transcriptional regulator [Burkholderiaceae bacterium]